MNLHVRDCLVEGYESLTEKLTLPDEDDRHVLAAAIKAEAEIILTFNLKDFPDHILQNYEIKAVAPDTLLSTLFDNNIENFILAFERQLASLKNPPKTAEELLEILTNQKLTQTVAKLKDRIVR